MQTDISSTSVTGANYAGSDPLPGERPQSALNVCMDFRTDVGKTQILLDELEGMKCLLS